MQMQKMISWITQKKNPEDPQTKKELDFEEGKTEQKKEAKEAEQKKEAEGAEQKKEAEGAEQKKEAEGAEQKKEAEEAEQKKEAEEAEQKKEAEGAEQRKEAEEAEQKKEAEGAEQRKEAEGAEQKKEPDQIEKNIKENFSGKKLGEEESKENYNNLKKRHDEEKRGMEKTYKELEKLYNSEKNKAEKMKKDYNNLDKNYNNLRKYRDEEKSKLKNELQKHHDEEKQKMEKKYKELEKSYNLEKQNVENMKKDYDKLKLEKQNTEKYMEENITSLEKQLNDQEKMFKQKFQQAQVTYKNNVENIRQKLNEKGNGLRELEEMNIKYREEASKYQSALGIATNIRLGDDDPDHSVKLNQDILKLQTALENYVTHLKPNMDLDIEQIQILAQRYGCLNEITVENPNKPFIKAILQREVLELVHRFSRGLSNSKGNDFALESDIDIAAIELLKLIEKFLTTRAGTDEVANATTIKIRQQVYGILGNRGFNDMTQSDGSRIHIYIEYVSAELNKTMNQYRKINDPIQEKQINAMAPKLVQDIFKLFWFRANVQEPIVEFEFFKNDKIDPNTMEGVWNDDEIDQLCVDICYFPLIGQNLNFSERKIYTFAKVFPRNTNEDKEENNVNE